MINRRKPEGPNLQISVLHRGIRAGLDGLQGREVKSPSLAYVKDLEFIQPVSLTDGERERERRVCALALFQNKDFYIKRCDRAVLL